jgi:hypothetical protein
LSSQDIAVYAADSCPYGLTYGEWSIKWWRWILSIPKKLNPSLDDTGCSAKINQADKRIFFLCQTFGRHGNIPRRLVKLPYKSDIFMPIINWISTVPQDGINEAQLSATAQLKIDAVETLQIIVNGKPLDIPLDSFRAATKPFQANLPDDNLLDLEESTVTCMSDGYWLFFQSRRKHLELSSFGSCSSGINKIGISYSIDFLW